MWRLKYDATADFESVSVRYWNNLITELNILFFTVDEIFNDAEVPVTGHHFINNGFLI